MADNENIQRNDMQKGTDEPMAGSSLPLNAKPSTENMEVHHHPHVGKKNFKEYFLEFLMIFLAVTLGFIAENLREHIGDKGKEHEYIGSLMADLKTDTTAMQRAITATLNQVRTIDTLEELLSSADLKNDQDAVNKCYVLNWSLQNEYSVNFNERTITQLVSSGNMRLLPQNVSDTIMDYFASIKNVENQKQFYVDYIKKDIDLVESLYDFPYMQTNIYTDTTYGLKNTNDAKKHLLNTDVAALHKFNTTVEFTKRVIFSYMLDLRRLRAKAQALLNFLQKEYD